MKTTYHVAMIADLETEASRQDKDALSTYGTLEGSDPRIAPLQRALAIWGLTADDSDIGVLSIHAGANVRDLSFTLAHIVKLFYQYRRKTKVGFGMTYSPPFLEALAMLSPSLLRKVSFVIRREGLLLQMVGLLQSVITGIIPGNRNSEYVPMLMNFTMSH